MMNEAKFILPKHDNSGIALGMLHADLCRELAITFGGYHGE